MTELHDLSIPELKKIAAAEMERRLDYASGEFCQAEFPFDITSPGHYQRPGIAQSEDIRNVNMSMVQSR